MLTNATISRIDRMAGADATGRAIVSEGSSIHVRANLQALSSTARYTLGAEIRDAEWTVTILRTALAGVEAPAPGDRIVAILDGETMARTGAVLGDKNWVAPGLSNYELYLKPVVT